ncbi:MAG TPA: prephenate dehydrogenase/arogenate dehydrogenase family protein [Phycisphaerae bacterium]|nr:prephenate dehydrogenase/arogenate dehydrogenase family protein [Phycisphaerae bacterium]
MAEEKIHHVTIVGTGLLGGSAGLALKAHDPSIRIAGVGRRQASLDRAREAGAIDTAHLDAAEAVAQTDLVILATPVGAFERHLRAIAPALRNGAIVTDVGSTKAGVVRAAGRTLGHERFVGSHPMAGSERKGVSFSRADLFAGATCILTPTGRTPADVTRRVERLWQQMGMRTLRMTPAAHDRAVARVSHLPHALASLLMRLPARRDLDVAATGFRDATRLAGGDPEMWRDIFLTNRRQVLAAIDDFDEDLMALRDLVELGEPKGLERFFAAAKKRRDTTIARVIHDRRFAAE